MANYINASKNANRKSNQSNSQIHYQNIILFLQSQPIICHPPPYIQALKLQAFTPPPPHPELSLQPFLLLLSSSAPASSRNCRVSTLPRSAAQLSGVWPRGSKRGRRRGTSVWLVERRMHRWDLHGFLFV